MNTNTFSVQSAPLVINGQTLTGGVNASFTPPNEQSVINQSLNFVNNANTVDQNFLGTTIQNSQNMFQSQTQPLANNLMEMLGGGMSNNDAQSSASSMGSSLQSPPNLLDMFNNQITLMGQNQSTLAENALQQIAIDTANTNATNAQASSGGGGCFITTAICESEGLPDNCEALTLLRKFRDCYLKRTEAGKQLILDYYHESPKIVEAIKSREDAAYIFETMKKEYLDDIVFDIQHGLFDLVVPRYKRMFYYAKKIANGTLTESA